MEQEFKESGLEGAAWQRGYEAGLKAAAPPSQREDAEKVEVPSGKEIVEQIYPYIDEVVSPAMLTKIYACIDSAFEQFKAKLIAAQQLPVKYTEDELFGIYSDCSFPIITKESEGVALSQYEKHFISKESFKRFYDKYLSQFAAPEERKYTEEEMNRECSRCGDEFVYPGDIGTGKDQSMCPFCQEYTKQSLK